MIEFDWWDLVSSNVGSVISTMVTKETPGGSIAMILCVLERRKRPRCESVLDWRLIRLRGVSSIAALLAPTILILPLGFSPETQKVRMKIGTMTI